MEEIKTINIEDKNYPKLLKKIKNPPKVLYFKGEFPVQAPCLAIVGTRKYSSYGRQITFEIAGDLADAGIVIVSGFAPGIDTFAHQAVIEKNKKTIAVLGTGLDKKSIYPQSNTKLVEKIIKNKGALISEYPPGTPGSKYSFPQRNRIIAGLCLGILVIEAKQKSGALITAKYGFEQNKKIFAVPGPIHTPNSKGPHYLIKKGARLVENANDILKEISSMIELNLPAQKRIKELKGETKEEQLVLEVLKETNLHIDKIIEKTNLCAAVVISALANLEITGKVRNLGGNIYTLKH